MRSEPECEHARRCNRERRSGLTTVARMGSVTHPRGRLPRRVYWVRRSIVLVVALLLVFGVGKLLGGTGKDDPGSAIKANTSSAKQAAGSIGHHRTGGAVRGRSAPRPPVPLLAPSGDCRDDEVQRPALGPPCLGRRSRS